MKIGDLSDRTGVAASTIRYYERVGLIDTAPRVSGRRDFDDAMIPLLRFVKLAQSSDFSIEEIKTLLRSHPAGSSERSGWEDLVRKKQQDLTNKIARLKSVAAVLSALLECTCTSFDGCLDLAVSEERRASPNDD
ncbi:MAG: MerR family transcriptional regulator [Pseudomonadota bacterium]